MTLCATHSSANLCQSNVVDFYTFVINGEKSEAQKLLLVQLLGSFHGLLVVDNWLGLVDRSIVCCCSHRGGLALTTNFERRIVVLEPLHLLVAEHLPDWVPFGVVCEALLGERLLAGVGLRSQASALRCAHVGKPAFKLFCEGGVVSRVCMIRMSV